MDTKWQKPLKALQIIWFQIYDILEMVKLQTQQNGEWFPRIQGKAEVYKWRIEEFLGQ